MRKRLGLRLALDPHCNLRALNVVYPSISKLMFVMFFGVLALLAGGCADSTGIYSAGTLSGGNLQGAEQGRNASPSGSACYRVSGSEENRNSSEILAEAKVNISSITLRAPSSEQDYVVASPLGELNLFNLAREISNFLSSIDIPFASYNAIDIDIANPVVRLQDESQWSAVAPPHERLYLLGNGGAKGIRLHLNPWSEPIANFLGPMELSLHRECVFRIHYDSEGKVEYVSTPAELRAERRLLH